MGDPPVRREFKRRLNAAVQEVWAALTEPEKLRQWYGVVEDFPVQGKKMQLVFEKLRRP